MPDIYCLICFKKGISHNKVIKKAPAGLCCDGCNSLSLNSCDKFVGVFSLFKDASKCTLCGHGSAIHYEHKNG
jgi:hypothetical protein